MTVSSGHGLYGPVQESDMGAFPEWLVRGVNAFAAHSLFHTAELFDRMRHIPSERYHDVEVARDLSYGAPGDVWQRLDVWRPRRDAEDRAPLPAMLFVHGGGFRTMSKRTHWFFARAFARMGFVVFSIDYRLGPHHPYPAPLQDAALALRYVAAHAEEHGADLERLVFAGESAGANLLTALTALCVTPQTQPWACHVYALGVVPRAILPMCGLLQVTDLERFSAQGVSPLVMGPIRDASKSYLSKSERAAREGASSLADPLVCWEAMQKAQLTRPLPAAMIAVGGSDPLKEDSVRLARAWRALGGQVELEVYPGGTHSFMAYMWMRRAQRCWEEMAAFLMRAQVLSPREALPDVRLAG